MLRFRSICVLVLVAACERTPARRDARPPESPALQGAERADGKWFDAFEPYPGARVICSEHAAGTSMHIQWNVYASSDSLDRVESFYRQRHGAIMADAGPDRFVLRSPNRAVLSVYPANEYLARPHCARTPEAREASLIMVSISISQSR